MGSGVGVESGVEVKSGKLIFRGKISDTHEKICIKFVQCYSAEVHKFCASINCAPRLLGFESLDGGWYMVVMEDLSAEDYIDLFKVLFSSRS